MALPAPAGPSLVDALCRAHVTFAQGRPLRRVLGELFGAIRPGRSVAVVELVPSEQGEPEWFPLGEWRHDGAVPRRPAARVHLHPELEAAVLGGRARHVVSSETVFIDGHPATERARCVPLRVDDEVIGALVVTGALRDDLEHLLPRLADSSAAMVDARRGEEARRAAQRRLAQSEATARALVQRSPDAVVLVGVDGRVCDVNPAAERLFGRGLLSVLGASAREVLGVSCCPTDWPCDRREVLARHHDGHALPLEATVHDVPNGGSQLRVLTLRDLREQRRSEGELQQLNDELRGRVAQLARLDRENQLLGELGGFLQACHGIDDVHRVLARFLPQLIEGASGAYFQHSGRLLTQEVGWGDAAGQAVVTVDDCWAMRRGEVHIACGPHDLVCHHRHDDGDRPSVCVPVMTGDGPVGLVHLLVPDEGSVESTQRVLSAVADRLGAAITNLRLRERLQQESIRDPLTGLFNRRYMVETLQRELARARRAGEPLSVVMADVDHFKKLNDSFGHDTGDHVLQGVAKCLRQGVRSEDVVCRYGGEEFVIILPGTTLAMARQRAEELCERLRHLAVPARDGDVPRVTMSAGVAHTDGSTGPDALLRSADRALLRAKGEGRDRVCLAEDDGTVISVEAAVAQRRMSLH